MISVIIPVYNAKLYIEECVESILAQTYSDFEILLLDDGSIDNSFEICDKLAEKDCRVKAFREDINQGVSATRNHGIKIAQGDFLTFIDADDWVSPDYLQCLITIQEKFDSSIAQSQLCRGDDFDRNHFFSSLANKEMVNKYKTQNNLEYVSVKASERVLTIEKYMDQLFFQGNAHCVGALYKTDFLRKNCIVFQNKITVGEDMLFWVECLLKVDKIAVSDKKTYCYYFNSNGAMEKKFDKKYLDQIICWQMARDRLLPFFPDLGKKLDSVLVVSIMLVIGKLAMLPKYERKKFDNELKYCDTLLRQNFNLKTIYPLLPRGYVTKVKVYSYFPNLYLNVYGLIKK